MAEGRAGSADADPRPGRPGTRWLSAAVVALVAYAGVAKALLFRNMEYWATDFYSFLEMSWSWHYAGRLLHDNAYGAHGAVHNFYILPLLSPLTVPLGAYGLILALTILYLVGGLRVARSPALDEPGRLVVLAALLGPVALFVFDNPEWGFHPELLYPPLVALLALDLLEGRRRRALLPAALILLVKEDGAALLAAVLVVHFSWRLWTLRKGTREERRRVLATGLLVLVAVTVIFAAGLALLAAQSEEAGPMLRNAEPRLLRSLKILGRTLAGGARPFHWERLQVGLVGYALVAGVLLLPLGRRLPGGLSFFLLSAPVVVAILAVSSAHYRFQMMLWPPRLALLLALLVACLAYAVSPPEGGRSKRVLTGAAGLALVSWGLQLLLLSRVGYTPWARLAPGALAPGNEHRVFALSSSDVRFLRCVAARLPGGLPVSPRRGSHPLFHRQSIVFEGLEQNAWHPPRLRVVSSTAPELTRPAGWCPGPRAGALAIEAECGLVPRLEECAGLQ